MKKKILVVDIGGSNVKLMISEEEKRRRFPSGPKLSPKETIAGIKEQTGDWDYDAISLGFPAPVRDGKIVGDKPKHLGKGWLEFDFAKALGKPARVVNDAALQALGSYRAGRTLFLGFGTGLGSALVWEGYVLSLELGDLPYVNREIIEAKIGDAALEEVGKKEWRKEALFIVEQLKSSFIADHVVLGGGNARLLEEDLPAGVELGHNRNVFPGGVRLWETASDGETPKWKII
jgi:polyphosphate glucokinase